MRKWKLWYLGIAILFLISGIAGAVILRSTPDAGLAEVGSIADLMDCTVHITAVEGDTDPQLGLADLVENRSLYVEEAVSAQIAVLATATGNLDITNSTFGQEVVVDQVYRGEEHVSPGTTCMVWDNYGLQVMDGVITYRNVYNLMQPGEQYLIFLEKNPLNEVGGGKNFPLASIYCIYLPVPYTPDVALPDGNRTGPYAQWANYPAFAATAEIAGARNQITQEILRAYGLYPD